MRVLWGDLGGFMSVYGVFMAKIAFLALWEACENAIEGRSGRSGRGHHSEKSTFGAFADALREGLGGDTRLAWV